MPHSQFLHLCSIDYKFHHTLQNNCKKSNVLFLFVLLKLVSIRLGGGIVFAS